MRGGGAAADEQGLGDVGVALADHHQAQHFELANRERFVAVDRRARRAEPQLMGAGQRHDRGVETRETVGRRHGPGLESAALSADWLAAQDAVLIVTDHSAYDWRWVAGHAALIVDTRNATRGVEPRGHIVSA